MDSGQRPPVEDRLQAIGATSLGEDPSPDAREAVLRRWTMTLDGADPLRVQLERDALASLPGLTAGAVDAALASRGGERGHQGDDPQGASLALEDPEPWPETVDGPTVFSDLEDKFTTYLALPDGAAPALAAWTLHAHALDAFYLSPILAVTSPVMRCGKTRVLELLGALVPRPLPASNITPAAVFRSIDKWTPTLLIDEADTFISRSSELRGVLNAGHSRRSAYTVRTVGDDHEAKRFSTWSPKAIALIGELPDTLADRSVEVRMRRKTAAETVEDPRRDRLDAQMSPLRRRAWTWAHDHLDALRAADPVPPPHLNDRAADNWRPLLAVGQVVGESELKKLKEAAETLSGGGADDRGEGVMLLADLRDLFEEEGAAKLPSKKICRELGKMEHRPWPEMGPREDRITTRKLASLLEPFEIKPKQFKYKGNKKRGYRREECEDAFTRYLGSGEAVPPVRSRDDGGSDGSGKRYSDDEGTGSENAQNPPNDGKVPGVPGQHEGIEGNDPGDTSTEDAFDVFEEFDSATGFGR